jgi:hypothetical protein
MVYCVQKNHLEFEIVSLDTEPNGFFKISDAYLRAPSVVSVPSDR